MEYGLIGEKLGHSYSKEIHAEIGDYSYELKEIPKDELESFIKERNFKGINVTIPYKQAVIPMLDHVDPAALQIGAVNTIVNRDGKLFGYNTDFIGLKRLILSAKINPKGKKVLILGTGGTSKTAFAAASALEANPIIFVSRSAEHSSVQHSSAQQASISQSDSNLPSDGKLPSDENKSFENKSFGQKSAESASVVTYEEAATLHSDASVIINTTPAGRFPKVEGCPINLDPFTKLEGVVDVIYNPLRTNLVLSAQKRKISAKGGLFMLVQQAVAASEFFFNQKLEEEKSEEIFKKILGQKQNIVLIGMPGSGKTTVGKILAKKLGREFLDTDKEIEKNQGKAPSDLIKELGESAFRDIESEECKKMQGLTGCIIATGGGAVLREENVAALKKNGILVFLDRKIENIRPTKDRPLSDSKEKLMEVFRARYPVYLSASDLHIISNENVNYTVNQILWYTGLFYTQELN